MQQQSARLYYQGRDHKDIFFQGCYHDKMYVGNQLVWEKYYDEIHDSNIIITNFMYEGGDTNPVVLFLGGFSGSAERQNKLVCSFDGENITGEKVQLERVAELKMSGGRKYYYQSYNAEGEKYILYTTDIKTYNRVPLEIHETTTDDEGHVYDKTYKFGTFTEHYAWYYEESEYSNTLNLVQYSMEGAGGISNRIDLSDSFRKFKIHSSFAMDGDNLILLDTINNKYYMCWDGILAHSMDDFFEENHYSRFFYGSTYAYKMERTEPLHAMIVGYDMSGVRDSFTLVDTEYPIMNFRVIGNNKALIQCTSALYMHDIATRDTKELYLPENHNLIQRQGQDTMYVYEYNNGYYLVLKNATTNCLSLLKLEV